MDPDKVVEAVESVYTGKLASEIKSKSSYALTGMMVGAIAGMMIASVMGKSRLLFSLAGAGIAGTTGYLIAKK